MTPTETEDQIASGDPITRAAVSGGSEAPAGADAPAKAQASADVADIETADEAEVTFEGNDVPATDAAGEDDAVEVISADEAFSEDDSEAEAEAATAAPLPADAATRPGDRVAKVMARAGLCSRRDAEAWIVAGRVAVNGLKLTTPAFNVTEADRVTVDGKPLPEREPTRVWLYHKPRGLVTTNSDPEGRPTIFERLPPELPRVMTVGRLDINTEGLLLLTNDGGLARTLELPATGWLRRYRVRAHGEVTQADLDRLADGIAVDGVLYGPIDAVLDRPQGDNVWITLSMREGKNREVKNVLGALGLEVNRLLRVSFGPFLLGELEPGEVREIRGKVLRDQLGGKIAADAGADFAPRTHATDQRGTAPRANARTPVQREPRAYPGDVPRRVRGEDDERPMRREAGFRPRDERRDDRAGGPPRDRGVWRSFEPRVLGVIDPKVQADENGDNPNAPIERRPAPDRFARGDDRGERRFDRPRGERSFGGDRPRFDRPRRDGDADARPRDFNPWEQSGGEGNEGGERRFDKPRGERSFGDKPRGDRPFRDRGEGGERRFDKPRGERSFGDKPRGERPFGDKPRGDRPFRDRSEGGERRFDKPRGERSFGDKPRGDRPFRDRSEGGERRFDKPRGERSFGDKPRGDRPFRDRSEGGERRFDKPRGERSFGDKPRGDKPFRDRGEGGERRFDKPRGERSFGDKPRGDKPFRDRGEGGERRFDKPRGERSFGDKPRGDKPFRDRSEGGERRFDKPRGERSFGDKPRGDKPFRDRGEGGERRFDKPRGERSFGDKPRGDRPFRDRSEGGERRFDKPRGERSFDGKPRGERPSGGRPQGDGPRRGPRPPRG